MTPEQADSINALYNHLLNCGEVERRKLLWIAERVMSGPHWLFIYKDADPEPPELTCSDSVVIPGLLDSVSDAYEMSRDGMFFDDSDMDDDPLDGFPEGDE